MSIPFVDLKAQYQALQSEIDTAINAVISECAFIKGPYVEAFESEFANYINAKHCISCANGTDAIEIVLQALGVGPGDEVIVPANSFIATSESVTTAGAKPVFVDCEPNFRNIDPEKLEEKITSKTKAIIAVHLYGMPADLSRIMKIAQRHNCYVIEDAAQAHGARYNGQRIGTIGHAATFSFFPGKNLGAYGDGGAITCQEDQLARKCRMIANHGRISKYDHEFEGRNSRLDGLQAAILSVKLKYLDNWNALRRQHADYYRSKLSQTKLVLPTIASHIEPVFHLYVVEHPEREKLRVGLTERGIGCGVHYPIALPMLQAYSRFNHSAEEFPNSVRMSKQALSLPMYPELTKNQIDTVVSAVEEVLG